LRLIWEQAEEAKVEDNFKISFSKIWRNKLKYS
jgi:hypothetical protein